MPRVDVVGTHDGAMHASLSLVVQLSLERLHESNDGVLRSAIVVEVGGSHHSRHGGNGDHTAAVALHHVGNELADHPEVRVGVHVHDALNRRFAAVENGLARHDSGFPLYDLGVPTIVDENVDGAHFLLHSARHFPTVQDRYSYYLMLSRLLKSTT